MTHVMIFHTNHYKTLRVRDPCTRKATKDDKMLDSGTHLRTETHVSTTAAQGEASSSNAPELDLPPLQAEYMDMGMGITLTVKENLKKVSSSEKTRSALAEFGVNEKTIYQCKREAASAQARKLEPLLAADRNRR